jgi:hypothetical protein
MAGQGATLPTCAGSNPVKPSQTGSKYLSIGTAWKRQKEKARKSRRKTKSKIGAKTEVIRVNPS